MEKNPEPVDMANIQLFPEFHTCQVVLCGAGFLPSTVVCCTVLLVAPTPATYNATPLPVRS